jgi:putative membrane protein
VRGVWTGSPVPLADTTRRCAGFLAIGLGGAFAVGLVAWAGAGSIATASVKAGWVLPPLLALHALQLGLSSVAWRQASGGGGPGGWMWARIRWIREAVNSLLPVAQVGGLVVGVRLLGQRGVPLATGSAGTTLDMMVEALAQFLFTLLGAAVLVAILSETSWLPWLGGAGAVLGLGFGVVALLRRAGTGFPMLRIISRSIRLLPGRSANGARGMGSEFRRLGRQRGALWRAGGLHLLAWLIGIAETWFALAAIGRPVAFLEALAIESLGMAARSAAFAIPGALGVQEGGLILVGGLLGVPAEAAATLSIIKRAREVLVGLSGLLAWQWTEGKHFAAR